jgi:hypothetical protein
VHQEQLMAIEPRMSTKIPLSVNARVVTGIVVTAAIASILLHGQITESPALRTSMKPNARAEAPPLRAAGLAIIEKWMNDCGWPWRKEDVTIGLRRLVCIDLRPYSGQPGHHVFVYQVLDTNVSLLFSTVIFRPPHPEKRITFSYAKNADSLTIASGDTQCLVIALGTLWCD